MNIFYHNMKHISKSIYNLSYRTSLSNIINIFLQCIKLAIYKSQAKSQKSPPYTRSCKAKSEDYFLSTLDESRASLAPHRCFFQTARSKPLKRFALIFQFPIPKLWISSKGSFGGTGSPVLISLS